MPSLVPRLYSRLFIAGYKAWERGYDMLNNAHFADGFVPGLGQSGDERIQ